MEQSRESSSYWKGSLKVALVYGRQQLYLLTKVVQSNKYYKPHAVGITFEVGLTTDRDLSVLAVLKKLDVFYSSENPEVTWYEPLYNTISSVRTKKLEEPTQASILSVQIKIRQIFTTTMKSYTYLTPQPRSGCGTRSYFKLKILV